MATRSMADVPFLKLRTFLLLLVIGSGVLSRVAVPQDYAGALTKCIMFFEGQRSGKLPSDQRMTWRRDSALNDGSLANVNQILVLICYFRSIVF